MTGNIALEKEICDLAIIYILLVVAGVSLVSLVSYILGGNDD